MSAGFVELACILVEGATDHFAGRPRDRNPYCPRFATDAYEAWLLGWDEAKEQLEDRGREEAARWLRDAA